MSDALPEYPLQMYRARYERARKLMEEMKFDGLFISGEENMFYFTGVRVYTAWTTYSRPFFAILPKDTDPILLCQENRLLHTRLSTWIKDIRHYEELNGPPAAAITQIIRDSGIRGKIGAELGYEQRINMPLATFRLV
jgi:Xaa-Pro aminopeptidase